jgi:hypothetical protein
VIRVAHDTSWFEFGGERQGLGPVTNNEQAFAGHFSLAVAADELRAPLGVLAVSSFVRAVKPRVRTKKQRAARVRAYNRVSREEKESARWLEGVREAEAQLGTGVDCIHVMDQEADNFVVLADLVDWKRRFVVRGSTERRLAGEETRHVDDALGEVKATAFRKVRLSPRMKPTAGHSRREERDATLVIRGVSVVLHKPERAQHSKKRLPLNVVQVFEPKPPEGAEPVEWTLYTTEPIDTPEALTAVVDHYRARWRIEEYFKAIKTGCSFEKRQLTTYASLLRALALLAPIAWHLLAIRAVARDAGDRPASDVVDAVQLDVLRLLAPSSKLPKRPTVRDVMRAVADVGGWIRQNGEPGWIVLGRGYEDLVKAEMVWRAVLARQREK